MPKLSPRVRRVILVVGGFAFTGLWIVGGLLPILPGTLFFLLAAWCFLQGSPRLHRLLTQNRLFGSYFQDYQKGRGIPLLVKVGLILWIWTSTVLSTMFVARAWWLRALLLLLAVGMTWNIARIPTRQR